MKYRVASINSYRFEKQMWYKAVVIVVKVNSVQVQFTSDGSTAILETDVLCNNRSFRYFDSDSSVTDIPDEADAPWEPTEDAMQVSTRADCIGVGSAMAIFRSINENSCSYGITVDAVHGQRRTSVVSDQSGFPMLVGTGTQEDLTGARLYVGDLGASGLEEGGLRLDSLANMLLTVQLHDFMTDFSVCLAAIPLVSETGPTN